MDPIDELLTRGVANIIPGKDELKKALDSGEKLNVYLGIDPTSTRIHLGHAVPLRQLQKFAEMGHNVTFLIGDFTALIGDTSDKDTERPVLTSEEIDSNFQTYKQQAEKIVDFSKVTVRKNSEWLSELKFTDVVKLTQKFSLGDFISRELIRKRLDSGKKVGLHEVLYPVMQGYDSFIMDTDLQIGGTDQTFNMQAGRTLQRIEKNKQSFIMANEFLEGTDGRKMSKSWGNAIWLTDEPSDMYGKVMSLKDDLIVQYFLLGTNVPTTTVEQVKKRLEDGENPMNLKKELAFAIVKELHSQEDARKAQEAFENVFSKGETPEHIEEIEIESGSNLLDVLVEHMLVISKSEAKRLIEQGGIKADGQPVDMNFQLTSDIILQIGKRKFVKISKK